MLERKTLTIAFDSDKITNTPGLMTWLNTIGAEVEEGRVAVVSFNDSTMIRGITTRRFRIFTPGIAGELTIDLELNVYETDVFFEWGGNHAE